MAAARKNNRESKRAMRGSFLLLPTCLALSPLVGCGEPDPVVARANGHEIKQSQFEELIKHQHPGTTMAAAKARALEEYISRAAMADALLKEDGTRAISDAEVEDFKASTIVSRHFDKYLNSEITEEAIQAYYKDHAPDYSEQKVHVAHILFRTDGTANETQRNEKLMAAKIAYAQLQSGKNFAEVAENQSEDPATRKRGGDLGWLSNTSSPHLFRRALSMKPDELTEPFRTAAGYEIIKLLAEPRSVAKPYQSVRAEIRARMWNDAKERETRRLLANARIEVNGKPREESSHAAASDSPQADPK